MGFWDSLYGGLKELFWYVVRHLMGYGGSFLATIVDSLIEALPSGVGDSLAVFSDYIDIANAWIPIDIGVVLLSTWITAKLAILTVRHIIKMIPTVG